MRRAGRRVVGHVRWRLGRIRGSVASAAHVRERLSYISRELGREPITARYELRGRPALVILRHNTDDTGVFAEIFGKEYYALPEHLSADLRSRGDRASFVDLGANIGLFGVWVLTRFPGAKLTAFEPDPCTLMSLREVVEINDAADVWTVIPACASNYDGEVAFAATGSSVAQIVAGGGSDATTRAPVVDVFDYLRQADVVKMDIEGGEWSILLDPRWRDVSARAVLMEYHPYGCPGPDARALARERLRTAGFVVEDVMHDAAGHGMLRALRG